MTELRRPDHEVIVGKIVGYRVAQEIPPDWKRVVTTFNSLAELWDFHVDEEIGAELFTLFGLPDGSIEEECGAPPEGGTDEIGTLAYRLTCTRCGQPHWWKGLAPTKDFPCAECNTGDEVPDEIEQFEREV